ncbi:MAG: AI-2E family transporter [Defluviitaleaceae bacterium]|nr:AI-2E family transporter [Defluviitaleaceae bacterium]MCL2238900.1 AI-2E family transporter [Defluviitaleaceae bacterium]MCL2239424.1 AI-2E family transporter [Defluviitaleaceae bacterium]
MGKFFKSRMMTGMVPYFILAVAVIITWHVIGSWEIFATGLGRFWGIITPFMYGLIVAYILNMPCSAIQRLLERTKKPFITKRSRGFAVLILFILILALLALVLNLIVPAVYRSVLLFVNEFENYLQGLLGIIERINNWGLPDFIGEIDPEYTMAVLTTWLTNYVEAFVDDFDGENVTAIFNFVTNVFGSVFATVFQGILTTVSSIFLLIQRDRIIAFVRRMVGAFTAEKTGAFIMKYAGMLNYNFRMYIYTQTIDGIILGTIMTIVLAIAGSPFFLLLGLMLGILNYIPYFGSIIGTAIALVVVAFTQGLGIALILLPIMFFFQQLDGNFIQPKLMGGSFSISPLLIIISVTIGGAYAGVLGMLMAIPIVAVLKDMLDNLMSYNEQKRAQRKRARNEEESMGTPDYYNPEDPYR